MTEWDTDVLKPNSMRCLLILNYSILFWNPWWQVQRKSSFQIVQMAQFQGYIFKHFCGGMQVLGGGPASVSMAAVLEGDNSEN